MPNGAPSRTILWGAWQSVNMDVMILGPSSALGTGGRRVFPPVNHDGQSVSLRSMMSQIHAPVRPKTQRHLSNRQRRILPDGGINGLGKEKRMDA